VAGSKIPRNVIDELSNDQDFLAMDEASQDEVMSQIEAKFGHIQKPENMLQRALKVGTEAFTPNRPDMAHPFQSAIQSTMGGLKRTPGLGSYMTGHDIKSDMAENLGGEGIGGTMLDIVSDPELLMGPGVVKSGAKKLFPYTSKESRVGFTKGVEKSLVKRRNALTRGYGKELNKSKGIVDISDIVDEGSEITQLTMKEAQDLKNAISQGIPEAVKSGVRVDPKHFGSREIAGMISERMKKADPEFAKHIEKYGKHAENFKSAISPIKGAKGSENIFGSNLVSQMFRGGGIPEKAQVALKEFAPRTAKKVSSAKINENIFRGIRGTAVATALGQFIPSALKRAFLSEVSK